MIFNKLLFAFGIVSSSCLCLFGQEQHDIHKIGKKTVSDKEKDEILKLVENYLNNITNLQCKFEQFSSKTGEVAKGTVYIKRPEVIRVEYKAPHQYSIVINNKNIICYDRDLKEESVLSKNISPFSIFLNRNISLKKFNVEKILVDHEHIYMDLSPKGDISDGILHLVFDENPIRLHQWKIRTDRVNDISVTVLDYKNKIDSNLSINDLKNCKKKLVVK